MLSPPLFTHSCWWVICAHTHTKASQAQFVSVFFHCYSCVERGSLISFLFLSVALSHLWQPKIFAMAGRHSWALPSLTEARNQQDLNIHSWFFPALNRDIKGCHGIENDIFPSNVDTATFNVLKSMKIWKQSIKHLTLVWICPQLSCKQNSCDLINENG